jgi:hypothetical protein
MRAAGTATALLAVVAAAGVPATAAAQANKAPSCRTPVGRTVAADASARVFTRSKLVWGCHARRARALRLGRDRACFNDEELLGAVVAGRHAAVEVFSCDTVSGSGEVRVRDLVTGRRPAPPRSPLPAPYPEATAEPAGGEADTSEVTALVLSRAGVAAWVQRRSARGRQLDAEVRVEAGGRRLVLDRGPEVVAGSLALAEDGTLTWRRGAEVRSRSLAGPAPSSRRRAAAAQAAPGPSLGTWPPAPDARQRFLAVVREVTASVLPLRLAVLEPGCDRLRAPGPHGAEALAGRTMFLNVGPGEVACPGATLVARSAAGEELARTTVVLAPGRGVRLAAFVPGGDDDPFALAPPPSAILPREQLVVDAVGLDDPRRRYAGRTRLLGAPRRGCLRRRTTTYQRAAPGRLRTYAVTAGGSRFCPGRTYRFEVLARPTGGGRAAVLRHLDVRVARG